MEIYKTKAFGKWAKQHSVTNQHLVNDVCEMSKGLIEANYGSGLFKKRIATKGRGKRGSVRTLLALRMDEIAVFLYGFEKNERENLLANEEKAYKIIARSLLKFTKREINARIKTGSLIEVKYDPK